MKSAAAFPRIGKGPGDAKALQRIIGAAMRIFKRNHRAAPSGFEELKEGIDIDFSRGVQDAEAASMAFMRTYGHQLVNYADPLFVAHLDYPLPCAATAGTLIQGVFNPISPGVEHSPIGVALEHALIGHFCARAGYGAGSFGIFTSGGSRSNEYGVRLALYGRVREATGIDVYAEGLAHVKAAGIVGKCKVFASAESHVSIEKACGAVGLGKSALVAVGVDSSLRMDPFDLERKIAEEQRRGNIPLLVVATAGTTASCAFDPLEEIGEIARRCGVRYHVDAAVGGAFLMAEEFKSAHLRGIAHADSITIDPHKLLFCPAGVSAFLVRDKGDLSPLVRPMPYYDPSNFMRDPVTYSLETTKPAMGIPVYLTLKALGEDGYHELFRHFRDLAIYAHRGISGISGIYPGPAPAFNCVTFRDERLGAQEQRLTRERLASSGISISETAMTDPRDMSRKPFLRMCFHNPHAERGHVDRIVEEIIKR